MALKSHGNMMGGSVELTESGLSLADWYDHVVSMMDIYYSDTLSRVYENDDVLIYEDSSCKDAAYWGGMLGYDYRRVEQLFAAAASAHVHDYENTFSEGDPIVITKPGATNA